MSEMIDTIRRMTHRLEVPVVAYADTEHGDCIMSFVVCASLKGQGLPVVHESYFHPIKPTITF